MIYLDNAATTRQYSECSEAMKRFAEVDFNNPSALYKPSVEVSREITSAKDYLCKLMRAPAGKLIFTASGTEADNLALFGAVRAHKGKIIVSEGEHAAVYNSAMELKSRGYSVVFAPILPDGSLNISRFAELVDENTSLVSIMHVNNETGAVNDLEKISKIIKNAAPNALFHSDGVQAFGKIPVDLKHCGVDMYSVSGHKLHGPKGIGALFVKSSVNLKPIIFGGGQEYGLRSATENVAGIAGFRCAADIVFRNLEQSIAQKYRVIELYKQELLGKIEDVILVSPTENCAPNILTVAFGGVRGEVLLHSLERHGIYVGIGSACSSKKHGRYSQLLQLPSGFSEGVIRISICEDNTEDEVAFVVEKLAEELSTLRKFSRK